MQKPNQDIAAYIAAIKITADSIRDLGRIPSGHLFAIVMPIMSLATFQRIIANLVAAEMVEKTAANELIWKGPRCVLFHPIVSEISGDSKHCRNCHQLESQHPQFEAMNQKVLKLSGNMIAIPIDRETGEAVVEGAQS